MNKLFNKIATITLGLAMAIGVGVAVGSYTKNVTNVRGSDTSISGGDMSYGVGDTGWETSGTGTYSGNGVKFDGAGDYIESPSLSSHSASSLKVSIKAGYNGSSGSVLTIYALGSTKDESNYLAMDTFTPNETYTSQSTAHNFTLTASETIHYIRVKMTSKTSNLGMKYCEVFKDDSGGGGGGDSGTYQFILSAGGGTNSWTNNSSGAVYSSITWKTSNIVRMGGYNAGYAGQQFGNGNSSNNSGSITITSAYNWGEETSTDYYGKTKINEIRLWLNNGSGTITTYDVKVGGTLCTKSGTIQKNTSANSDYKNTSCITYTPNPNYTTGAVVITVASTSKAWYFSALEIDCEAPVTHTVDFNVQEHGDSPASQTIVDGGKVTKPSDPEEEGWTFGGWYKESTCSSEWNFNSDTVTDDITLYAKWTINTYTVSFNVQGHGTAPGNQTIQYNGKVTQPAAPSATGYTFGGWYKESGCTNAWNFNTDVITGARTLYAKWTANKYNINYYDKGGSAFSGTHASGYPTQHTYGTTTTLKTATKEHYSFDGWFTSIDCSGTAVTSLGATAYTDAIDLYAKWTIDDYAIVGHITNGSLSSTDRVDYYEPLNISIVPASGYTYPSSLDNVTMGGVAYYDYTYSSSDGAFSIAHVTGDVVITALCPDPSATKYLFDYDLSNCSIEDAPESMYSNEIKELQIVPDEHYKLPAKSANLVNVTGAVDWDYDDEDGTITIDGAEDDLVVSVECVAKVQNTIDMGTLTGVIPAAGNPDSVEEGEIVSLTFTASSGYGLPGNDGVTVTGAGSTWNQGTGTLQITGGTSREITVSIIGIQRDLTDGNLTLGAKKTSYTLGDDFELPSTVTANFNIAPLTADVKNDVEVSGPITNGVVSGSGTITLTYTYETTGKTQTASYSVTATPIVPTAAKYVKVATSDQLTTGQYLIVCEDSSVAFDGSLTSFSTGNNVDVEINSNEIAYSNETNAIEFTINVTDKTIYSKSGYYINNTGDSNDMKYTTNSAANTSFAITNGNFVAIGSGGSYLRFNSSSGQECFKYFKSSTYTGQKAVQLYKYQEGTVKELKWITATVNEGTYYQGTSVTSNNFTVTAHYNGGTQEDPQSEVVTNNITVTNGYLNNIGNNEVTLTYGGKSCNVNVVAIEQTAALTGLSWAQGELTIIDGDSIAFSELGAITASYEGGLSFTIAISSCTVSIYTKEGEVYTKVSDITDGATITSASHGKYLGVTYTENTVTKIAYSSDPIYVVESINSVYNKEKTFSWELVSSISIGDTVVFTGTKADGTEPNELTGVSGTTGTIAAFETTTPSGTYKLTVVEGASDGQFAFKDEDGNYLSHSGADKTLSLSDTINSNSSWTVQFDNEEPTKAIILNAYSGNPLQYNPGNCFRVYSTASQQPVKIYKGEAHYSPIGSDIANTDAIAQKVVLEYAEHFNDVMECIEGGTTTNVSGKWDDLAEDFANWFKNGDKDLTEDQVEDALALFAGADAKEAKIGGDTLQDMLARYEYICAKYKLDDFLNEEADRPPVAKRGNFLPLFNIAVNPNAAAIVIIVSALSITAVGGYFFLRKKKEQ